MDFSRYVEWIKLSPRYLVPLSLFSGFILFAPSDVLSRFGLAPLLADYRPYFGLVFLLSTILLLSAVITAVVTSVYGGITAGRRRRAREKEMEQRLHQLAEPEKMILRGFLYNETRSQKLSMTDGTVGGLEAEQIIFRSSNVGDIEHWAYNIQPWAWDYLTSRPKLLALQSAETAGALLLRYSMISRADLSHRDEIKYVYNEARERLEADMFAKPQDFRLAEEAKRLLLKQAAT